MSKIKTLTLRPSAARGERQSYSEFLDQWLNVLVGDQPDMFKAASMSGGAYSSYTGELPAWAREVYMADKPSYVIYSYATPLAWLRSDGSWAYVDHRYSVTTSKHQSHLRHLFTRMGRNPFYVTNPAS